MAAIETIEKIYKAFDSGNIPGFIDLCADDCKFNFPAPKSVPYSGEWRKGDPNGRSLLDLFKCIGGAWGAEPEKIEMKWDNFKVDGSHVTNTLVLRVCTQDGRIINGTDNHVWDLTDDLKKIKGHENDCAAHCPAYAQDANQTELMAKLCWSLFGEGKTDAIIKHTQHSKAVFSLLQEGDLEKAKKIPYAGRYTVENMAKPFAAMVDSWVMDASFSFKPTSFQTNGDTCVMNAAISAKTKAGKSIKTDKEKHVCVTAPGDNGCLKVVSWDVTGSLEPHYAGFC